MSAKGYPIVFSEVKAKVGIDDVAYSLGYRLNKKAGVGRYFELVLGPLSSPTDTIIVRNTPDKRSQTFFRRNGSKGDVVSFIRENLNSFNVPGGNDEWMRVTNVLASFANLPTIDYSDKVIVEKSSGESRVFDPQRFAVTRIEGDRVPYILYKRGFSLECVRDFGDSVVLIQDKGNSKFDGYNIGFPYRNPETGELAGFEIRGNNGFKSKAAGTDSAHSAWMAEFADTSDCVRNVYFFESSFDAMAFYQLNKAKLRLSPFALVSMGGSFSETQLAGVVNRYPSARFWDCFDNDIAGHNYTSQFVKAIDKTGHTLSFVDGKAILSYEGKTASVAADDFSFREAAKIVGMPYGCGHWKAPSNFKDWNDTLMNRPIEQKLRPWKYQRDENLAQRRQSSVKL